MDLTGGDDPLISVLPLKTNESLLTQAPVPLNRDTGHTPDGVPPVLNGFLTWLNTVEDKKVGGLARAFHLAMQLAGCDIPNFQHDSLRRQWERLRALLGSPPSLKQSHTSSRPTLKMTLLSRLLSPRVVGVHGGGRSLTQRNS